MYAFRIILCAFAVLCIGCSSSEETTPKQVLPKADFTEVIRVAIPIYKYPQPKPMGPEHYEEMRQYLFRETGKLLHLQEARLDELNSYDPSLLHLVGSEQVYLEPTEVRAIESYLAQGGTILIENLGGTGEFAWSMRDQLIPLFPGSEEKVSTRSDIITGRNLPEGAKSNRRVFYRRMVIERFDPDGRLLLRGWNKDDRYPMLLSYEDLSLGMQGVEGEEIYGYEIETARNLMLNILLEAHQAQKRHFD